MKMKPYIEVVEKRYNINYGDGRLCKCGCIYLNHFNGFGCTSFEDVNEIAGMEMSVKQKALEFATKAHAGIFTPGMSMQMRKYSDEPYIMHPIEVAKILADHGYDDDVMQSAAYLHDVVEDCGITHERVLEMFGEEIAEVVKYVTDVSTPADGNRKVRKTIDRNHYARGNHLAQTLKVADMISNTRSIVVHDTDFARVYLPEKQQMLDVLTKADEKLVTAAKVLLADSIVALGTMGITLRW